MARGDLVPPLADTLDVIAALTPAELDRCWIWVATPRHVEKAAAAGARHFQYCLSASDSHNKANIGRTTEDSVAAMPDAVQIAREVGGSIQLCIATAFTCPFEGLTDPRAGARYRQRPAHRRCRRHRGLRHHRSGHPHPGVRSGHRHRDADTAAPHRFSRSRHVGDGRGQQPCRHRRRCSHGRRFARRTWRLPVRAGRQRQHLQRGSAVRDEAGLVHPEHAGLDGGRHREDARRTRRAEPVTNRAGRAVQGHGLRLGDQRSSAVFARRWCG